MTHTNALKIREGKQKSYDIVILRLLDYKPLSPWWKRITETSIWNGLHDISMENVLSNRLCYSKRHDDCAVIKYLHNIAVIIIKLIIIGLKRKRKQWKIISKHGHLSNRTNRQQAGNCADFQMNTKKTWLNRFAHCV